MRFINSFMAGKKHPASPEVGPEADLASDDEVQLLSPPVSKSKKAHPSDLVLCAIFSRLTDRDFTCKLVPMRSNSSKIHNSSVRVSSKSYSNLRDHATIWHSSIYTALCQLRDSGSSLDALESRVEEENIAAEKILSTRKPIKLLFQSLTNKPEAILQSRCAYALHMIRKGHSFNSLCDTLLQKSFQYLGKDTVLGDRRSMENTLVPFLFAISRKSLYEHLSGHNVRAVSLTCDSWTDNTAYSYIGITIHYVDRNFEPINKLLEVFPFEKQQTSSALVKHMQSRVKLNLPDETIIWTVTIDNGRNYVKAMSDFMGSDDVVLCFAHTLQLCVRDVLTLHPYKQVLEDINSLEVQIRNKKKYRQVLRIQLKEANFSSDVLPKANATRWSSDFRLLDRFVQFYQVLHQLKLDGVFESDVSVLISDDRYSSAKELRVILSKFAEITSQCQALSESQVANVPFWISRLQDHLLGFHNDSARLLSESLNRRFSCIKSPCHPANLCAVIHPEFYKMTHLNEIERTAVIQEFISVAIDLGIKPKVPEIHQALIASLHKEFSLLDSYSLSEFWKNPDTGFTMYVPLIRMMLSAQATSAPCEVAFTIAGFQKDDHRSRLRPSLLNMLCVLGANACRTDEDAEDLLMQVAKYADGSSRAEVLLTDDLQDIIKKQTAQDTDSDDDIDLFL